MFNVVKHVVIASFEPGGDEDPVVAAFRAMGEDYARDLAGFSRHDMAPAGATYEFPGPEAGSTVTLDVSYLNPQDGLGDPLDGHRPGKTRTARKAVK